MCHALLYCINLDNRHMHSKPCNCKVENLCSHQGVSFHFLEQRINQVQKTKSFGYFFLDDHQALKEIPISLPTSLVGCYSSSRCLAFFFKPRHVSLNCLANSLDVDVILHAQSVYFSSFFTMMPENCRHLILPISVFAFF